MTKNITASILLAAAAFTGAASLTAQPAEKKDMPAQQKKQVGPMRASPHETTYARVGPDRRNSSLISITYGRPYSARGGQGEARKIWGGLVPWDKADRLGADEATLILLQHPIVVGQTTIPAGAHTLYIVPSETATSKLAFSSHIGKWGIPVDETKDIARVDLKKEPLAEDVNQLTLVVESTGGENGVLKIMWEKTQFSLPFSVKRT